MPSHARRKSLHQKPFIHLHKINGHRPVKNVVYPKIVTNNLAKGTPCPIPYNELEVLAEQFWATHQEINHDSVLLTLPHELFHARLVQVVCQSKTSLKENATPGNHTYEIVKIIISP
jgi:hypothetical protein